MDRGLDESIYELNVQIAQKVMRWHFRADVSITHRRSQRHWYRPNEPQPVVLPAFTKDMNSALLVIARLAELGYWCQMRTPFERDSENDYWAGFTPHSTTGWNGKPDHWTRAETLPLAICRAALQAVKETHE